MVVVIIINYWISSHQCSDEWLIQHISHKLRRNVIFIIFNLSWLFYIFILSFFLKKTTLLSTLFICLFLAALGLRFCARAFSSCGERGPLFITVRGPLTVAASLVAGHSLQTRRLSSCGSRALLLCGMWDLPRPGLEPVSPALAGSLSTTAPPGKPHFVLFFICMFLLVSEFSGHSLILK